MTISIRPQELAVLCQSGKRIELIDVRTPVEFRELHVDFARNVPLDKLDPKTVAVQRNGGTSELLYVICQSGSRGKQACDRFAAVGLNAVNVEGGMIAWEEAGLPVIRDKKTISLERQVRIAIGLIVLASSALAAFIHPIWIGLAAFMGGGLIFSGITDFCGLALILARLPWNQLGAESREANDDQTATCCTVHKSPHPAVVGPHLGSDKFAGGIPS